MSRAYPGDETPHHLHTQNPDVGGTRGFWVGGTELLLGPWLVPCPLRGKGGYRDHGYIWISLVPLLTQGVGETALCTQSAAQKFPPASILEPSNAAPLPPLTIVFPLANGSL